MKALPPCVAWERPPFIELAAQPRPATPRRRRRPRPSSPLTAPGPSVSQSPLHPSRLPQVYSTPTGAPYPVILSALWLTDQQTAQAGGVRFLPFEFSPLYGGCPSLFAGLNPAVGGGFVKPLGARPAPRAARATRAGRATCPGGGVLCSRPLDGVRTQACNRSPITPTAQPTPHTRPSHPNAQA